MAKSKRTPGDHVTVTLRSARRERVVFQASTQSPLRVRDLIRDGVDLELWDRAPESARPMGYVDPWWCRDAEGQWYIAAFRRGTSDPDDIVAYPVDDEVRFRLASTKADPLVTHSVLRNMGYGRALFRGSLVGVENPVVALLHSPIL